MIVLSTNSIGYAINQRRGEYPNFKIMGGVIYNECPAHVNPKKFKKNKKKIKKIIVTPSLLVLLKILFILLKIIA